MKTSTALWIVLAGSGVFASSIHADSYSPRVGQAHPEMTLPRIDNGEPVSLSHYRGKKVLLIHFASW